MPERLSGEIREQSAKRSTRLHYLDWLRVLAILGVFLVHALHPFDTLDWHIKNAQQSEPLSFLLLFLFSWGMPLFFLISGAASRFALQRRTGRQYTSERIMRLLIPFIIGSIVLSPIQKYLEVLHKGTFAGSFLAFVPEFFTSGRFGLGLLSPRIFGAWGIHLWFLGFLFAYSLLALPLFLWLERDTGRRLIAVLAGWADKRGGILLFVVPLAIVRIVLQPYFPENHDWADFVFMFGFFIFGYVIFADQRFARAIRRDRAPLMIGAVVGVLAQLTLIAGGWGEAALSGSGSTVGFLATMLAWGVLSWCWSLSALVLGMQFLDFRNRTLEYGMETIMPFYLLHQPVIIAIAFYAVQWEASILPKLVTIVIGAFVASVALVEVSVRPIRPVRILFGMRPRMREG